MTYPTLGPPRRLGLIALAVACACIGPAIPLHCLGPALWIGGLYLLIGGLQGALLAVITRTRRPWLIYLTFLAFLALFWTLYNPIWPEAALSLRPWKGAPDLVYNYFDALRPLMLVLGIGYPYAQWGQHGPDILTTR